LLADYSRKGYVHGISIRLPTIVVRPGKANAAASGFLSGIIREPLAGLAAKLPVSADTKVWIASPDVAVETLVHAAELPADKMKSARRLNGRGITVTVGEMIDALERISGTGAASLIEKAEDTAVANIVTSWPSAFEVERARELDFPVDAGIDAIIRQHLARVHT
jgi:nucleoside-diphosphate-sugar epimerase